MASQQETVQEIKKTFENFAQAHQAAQSTDPFFANLPESTETEGAKIASIPAIHPEPRAQTLQKPLNDAIAAIKIDNNTDPVVAKAATNLREQARLQLQIAILRAYRTELRNQRSKLLNYQALTADLPGIKAGIAAVNRQLHAIAFNEASTLKETATIVDTQRIAPTLLPQNDNDLDRNHDKLLNDILDAALQEQLKNVLGSIAEDHASSLQNQYHETVFGTKTNLAVQAYAEASADAHTLTLPSYPEDKITNVSNNLDSGDQKTALTNLNEIAAHGSLYRSNRVPHFLAATQDITQLQLNNSHVSDHVGLNNAHTELTNQLGAFKKAYNALATCHNKLQPTPSSRILPREQAPLREAYQTAKKELLELNNILNRKRDQMMTLALANDAHAKQLKVWLQQYYNNTVMSANETVSDYLSNLGQIASGSAAALVASPLIAVMSFAEGASNAVNIAVRDTSNALQDWWHNRSDLTATDLEKHPQLRAELSTKKLSFQAHDNKNKVTGPLTVAVDGKTEKVEFTVEGYTNKATGKYVKGLVDLSREFFSQRGMSEYEVNRRTRIVKINGKDGNPPTIGFVAMCKGTGANLKLQPGEQAPETSRLKWEEFLRKAYQNQREEELKQETTAGVTLDEPVKKLEDDPETAPQDEIVPDEDDGGPTINADQENREVGLNIDGPTLGMTHTPDNESTTTNEQRVPFKPTGQTTVGVEIAPDNTTADTKERTTGLAL